MSFGKTPSDLSLSNLTVSDVLVVGKRLVVPELFVSGKSQQQGLGTAAFRNVPPVGDATPDEVVLGSDTRLTDARTPLSHAATHGINGSDPVSLDSKQITNFQSTVAAMFINGNNNELTQTGTGVNLKIQSNVFGSLGVPSIFCYEGGPYSTGQDAIDAVPNTTNGAVVVLFPKKSGTGSWGQLKLPADIPMSVTAFATPKSKTVLIDSIVIDSSSSPTQNILFNEYYISNLYINNSLPTTTNHCIRFTGTQKCRLRVYQCYIQAQTDNTSCVLSTTTH